MAVGFVAEIAAKNREIKEQAGEKPERMSELQQPVDGIRRLQRFGGGKHKTLFGRHACRDGLGRQFGAAQDHQHDETQRGGQICRAFGDERKRQQEPDAALQPLPFLSCRLARIHHCLVLVTKQLSGRFLGVG